MLHYTSCGLQNIWLRNGYTTVKTAYGEATSIHDLDGLHKAIGLYLVNNKPRLTGAELRFLRKELDLSQSHLATMLGVSEPSIRGWENNRSKVSAPAEKILRAMYAAKVNGHRDINSLLERISQLNRDIHSVKIELEETKSGWKQAA
ncbi:DNA-binding transcriptional regulator [Nitrosomonas sp. Nm58]|jgi:DNA-binding transcriptional regulator YiaG|uniref:helix-turn-helix domain-containing protein n=1 Tax=Nitrosomonas sp. Nm58 TaxID=200126 RepID=UPI000898BFD9|nr:helix-turn-helix domain-containing protein [Nitrosomonas sp. Nm58]SDY38666.1 DNA-binding transcriptional regulator YiaG, contains XRE-type HTH domain [Nitrosomonas sp. Nm58]